MALTRFPGLIDIHVHLRDPVVMHKEDFRTGSRAAVKGGITFVGDMPNNPGRPTITPERIEEKVKSAESKSICDISFYYGTDGKNLDTFSTMFHHPRVMGLKIITGKTTGEILLDDPNVVEQIMRAWECDKPILVHAEREMLDACLSIAHRFGRRLHVCHVPGKDEVDLIRAAKRRHQRVTAGITPHYLYFTDDEVKKMNGFGLVSPMIRSKEHQDALWDALQEGIFDVFESDHAPHTKEEKTSGPCYGMPELETSAGLFLKAVHEKKITLDDFKRMYVDNPKKIFSIADQENTYIAFDPNKPFIVGADGYETKCGWSAYDGWELYGKVEAVVLRGRQLVREGKLV